MLEPASATVKRYVSYDTETYLIAPGYIPKIVCASYAERLDGKIVGNIIGGADEAVAKLRELLLDDDIIICFVNAPFDLIAAAEHDVSILPLIFRVLRLGRIHDVPVAEALHAIRGGHLGLNPNGTEMINPATGKVTKRYSLALCVQLVLGRSDAKARDDWRLSYALLDGIPVHRWSEKARLYPIDDACNTLEVALAQAGQSTWRRHEWSAQGQCIHCGITVSFGVMPACIERPRPAHNNLGNLAAQCEADFALKLGAAWGLRTDVTKVAALEAEVTKKHAAAVERLQKQGWVREDGSEDTIAIKKAIVEAYGGEVPCKRCGGKGRVPKVETVECRGVKERGRYRGCLGTDCTVCKGNKSFERENGERTCKNEFDDNGTQVEEGCDGTGYDLDTVPLLKRTDTLGVATDADTKTESGNEDLVVLGENAFEKVRTTYVPYLITGTKRPLSYLPNVLVATGRCSVEGGPIQQFPRDGGVRECVVARDGYVLCSTDYAAGELCTFAQVCLWLVGHSRMAEVINATKDPGSLHTLFAAQMLGISFEEAKARLKAGDKQVKMFRQAAKAADFGLIGGMGAATFVAAKRKAIEGSTIAADGTVYAGIRFCILLAGKEQCGVEKVTRWNNNECKPICKACVNIVEEMLKPFFFQTWTEAKPYLKKMGKFVEKYGYVPQMVWNKDKGEIEVVRERGGVDYTSGNNSPFQGMLGDIGKRAFVNITRECYLGTKPDGSPSPLYGCRVPIFYHDEPVAELRKDVMHEAAWRISELAVEAGRDLAPDVYWKAEPALSMMLSKAAETVIGPDGRLAVWEPKVKQ